KELLAEAGYPGGKGLPILRYDAPYNTKISRNSYELFKGYVNEIGIKTSLIVNDWPNFLNKLETGDFQLAAEVLWYGDYPDPQNFLQLLYSPNSGQTNFTRYKNAEFDQLYEKTITMQPSPERTQIYRTMTAIAEKDHPIIFDIKPLDYDIIHKRLRNYRHNQFARNTAQYLEVVE
ncbi:MAG: ABC transporter substrate-binding protein, partial [Spirochaetota bacterium]